MPECVPTQAPTPVAGLCWVASGFGIDYLFARRSFKLFLIDGGFHTLQFTAIGLILALRH